eukprot:gene12733-15979_t
MANVVTIYDITDTHIDMELLDIHADENTIGDMEADIRNAIQQLNAAGIIYIDLRRDNIGYSHDDAKWKIFDFDASGIVDVDDDSVWLMEPPAYYIAVFEGIREPPFIEFWDSLDLFDQRLLRNNLTIIAYDTSIRKPVFLNKCGSARDLYASVAASTRHPYLFRTSRLTDGNAVPFEEIEKHANKEHRQEKDKWLIIDLGSNTYDGRLYPYVYGPDIGIYGAHSIEDAASIFKQWKKMSAPIFSIKDPDVMNEVIAKLRNKTDMVAQLKVDSAVDNGPIIPQIIRMVDKGIEDETIVWRPRQGQGRKSWPVQAVQAAQAALDKTD